jgi:hypothetical protein
MEPSFFRLPLEIRLDVYNLVFGHGKAIIEAKVEDDSCCMIPQDGVFQNHSARSSQLLRVSRTVLFEARPVLYDNTVFHVVNQAFAGKLPARITDGHPCAPHVRHLLWQLDCDMLKHFYAEDLQVDLLRGSQLNSLELRFRADAWRDSFIGEWCDREAFLKGRAQVIEYARRFYEAMSDRHGDGVAFVEDRSQLGRGRIILKLGGTRFSLKQQRSSREDALAIVAL